MSEKQYTSDVEALDAKALQARVALEGLIEALRALDKFESSPSPRAALNSLILQEFIEHVERALENVELLSATCEELA